MWTGAQAIDPIGPATLLGLCISASVLYRRNVCGSRHWRKRLVGATVSVHKPVDSRTAHGRGQES